MSQPSASGDWLDRLHWNQDGLIPVVTQESGSGRILMQAWMNRAALRETAASGQAVYWSRTREQIWRKGEDSGHFQEIVEIRTDCDLDCLLLVVKQVGGIACHTGRHSCFFLRLGNSAWETVEPVLRDPRVIYKNS
jgi:phosphoribosyl-AMP cyclohydrolase